jgi:putative ABC transport system permease protein
MRRRKRMLEGLDADIRDHIERETQDNIDRGMPPEEARRAAFLKFGSIRRVTEETCEVWTVVWLGQVLQDVRYGLRMLRKNPVFATVAILTLALGIGCTSAVFSAVDRILFRSLPYPESRQLVSFGLATPFFANELLMAIDFADWKKDSSSAFTDVTSVHPGGRTCDLGSPNPVRLECQQVDSNFLPTLAVKPILGRNFTLQENEPNAAPVALLSYGLWRSRYGGDPNIVGRSISLNGKSAQVVGVLPSSFEMPTLARADLLIPQNLDFAQLRRGGPQPLLFAFARLKPGVTIAEARASLEPIFEQSLKFVPPQFQREVTLSVRSLRDREVHDATTASWVLLASVIALLLLATTNVANLLLARAAARRRETAVRAALGASRGRLARQSVTESLLLSLAGALIGCWLAYGLLRFFVAIAPDGIPLLQRAGMDLRVLLFTLGVSVVCGFLFGSTPAWQTPRPEMLAGKEAEPVRQGFLRQLLVTLQIAISLILLTGASFLLRSLWNLQSVPLGMDPHNVITANTTLAPWRYPQEAQQQAFFEQLQQRLGRIPGISELALSQYLPPSGRENAVAYARIEIPGRARPPEGTGSMIGFRAVTAGYFPALDIPILQGRAFRKQDLAPGQNAVVLSRSLARKLFGNEDPVGKRIRFDPNQPWHVIVGVAADVKNNGIEAQADPEFYLTWNDGFRGAFDEAYVIVRTPVAPNTMAKWVRSEVASLDPEQPITIETMTQRVSGLEDRPRFDAILLSFFALAGLVVAAIGIYGVVGFLVAQRRREIGVRMALGATPNAILRLMLGDVARWAALGGSLGFAGSWFATRMLRSLLFHVPTHDPPVIAAVVLMLVGVAFIAGWIPARRAMRVDPMVALRHD